MPMDTPWKPLGLPRWYCHFRDIVHSFCTSRSARGRRSCLTRLYRHNNLHSDIHRRKRGRIPHSQSNCGRTSDDLLCRINLQYGRGQQGNPRSPTWSYRKRDGNNPSKLYHQGTIKHPDYSFTSYFMKTTTGHSLRSPVFIP